MLSLLVFDLLKASQDQNFLKTISIMVKRGMYYSKAELLEVSIVTIPANGEATMLEQKFYNAMKEEILLEVKEVIQDNLIVNKHILSVREEDDRYIVEFAKPEMEMEEEAMKEEEEKAMEEEEEEKEMEKMKKIWKMKKQNLIMMKRKRRKRKK